MAIMLWQRLKNSAVIYGMLVCLVATGWSGVPCAAAIINYPDQGPVGGVTFTNIFESSGTDAVPLYGPPTAFVVGMDFEPASFVATAGGGAQDVTDGQLNFTAMTTALGQITGIDLSEAGDYSLSGVGGAATQALAGAIIRATVTQINGVDVAPIPLTPVNATVGFNLQANPGLVQPWNLGLSLNVAAQLNPNQRATKVEVVIDNQLQALSESGSLAFIAKKDFRIDVDTEIIPEPATLMMMLGGCLALASVMRRRTC
jgi:hypothetical protein